jgi:hypothetical protein
VSSICISYLYLAYRETFSYSAESLSSTSINYLYLAYCKSCLDWVLMVLARLLAFAILSLAVFLSYFSSFDLRWVGAVEIMRSQSTLNNSSYLRE